MKRYLLALVTFSLVAGCQTATYLKGSVADKYAEKFVISAATSDALGFGHIETQPDTAMTKATLSGDQLIQSATVLALLSTSDVACEEYMAGMITASNTVISGLGIANLALSGAASLTSPTRSANLLSGLATFAGGTEKELSDTALGGKSPALLYKSVMALRKKERAKILALLTTAPFALSTSDLTSYHGKCGPTVGINALEQAVDKASNDAGQDGKEEAKEEIEEFRQLLNQ